VPERPRRPCPAPERFGRPTLNALSGPFWTSAPSLAGNQMSVDPTVITCAVAAASRVVREGARAGTSLQRAGSASWQSNDFDAEVSSRRVWMMARRATQKSRASSLLLSSLKKLLVRDEARLFSCAEKSIFRLGIRVPRLSLRRNRVLRAGKRGGHAEEVRLHFWREAAQPSRWGAGATRDRLRARNRQARPERATDSTRVQSTPIAARCEERRQRARQPAPERDEQ